MAGHGQEDPAHPQRGRQGVNTVGGFVQLLWWAGLECLRASKNCRWSMEEYPNPKNHRSTASDNSPRSAWKTCEQTLMPVKGPRTACFSQNYLENVQLQSLETHPTVARMAVEVLSLMSLWNSFGKPSALTSNICGMDNKNTPEKCSKLLKTTRYECQFI